jgi:hypothetical protein
MRRRRYGLETSTSGLAAWYRVASRTALRPDFHLAASHCKLLMQINLRCETSYETFCHTCILRQARRWVRTASVAGRSPGKRHSSAAAATVSPSTRGTGLAGASGSPGKGRRAAAGSDAALGVQQQQQQPARRRRLQHQGAAGGGGPGPLACGAQQQALSTAISGGVGSAAATPLQPSRADFGAQLETTPPPLATGQSYLVPRHAMQSYMWRHVICCMLCWNSNGSPELAASTCVALATNMRQAQFDLHSCARRTPPHDVYSAARAGGEFATAADAAGRPRLAVPRLPGASTAGDGLRASSFHPP